MSSDYRLLTYVEDGHLVGGVLRDGQVIKLSSLLDDTATVLGALERWDAARERLEQSPGAAAAPQARPLQGLRLASPILFPPAIYGAAANYQVHIRELSGTELPPKSDSRPIFFLKAGRCIAGPDANIAVPRGSQRLDWEAELAVVIGRAGRDIAAADAMNHVAGYTIMNDLSDKSQLPRRDRYGEWFGFDWFRIKSFDGSAPLGPWLTPRDAIPDPYRLKITLNVNEERMQEYSTAQMNFSIEEQIEYLSESLTLQPGDVIATGTGSGVGTHHKRFLKAGDRIEAEIEGLGVLRTMMA